MATKWNLSQNNDQKTKIKFLSYYLALLLTLNFFDFIPKRSMRLSDNPGLPSKIPSLEHRRAVGELCLDLRYFHNFYLDKPAFISRLRSPRNQHGAHKAVTFSFCIWSTFLHVISNLSHTIYTISLKPPIVLHSALSI